jgi:thiamine-monophosphate kinase
LMTLLTPDGSRVELKPGGWEHFSGNAKRRKKQSR